MVKINKGIQDISIDDIMNDSYMDYAMSVIVSRALPDIRDGLKPVHRRILYSMYINNYLPDKSHKKSARVVGDVMGKFHPHGDSAIYDALVRLAQDFSMNLILIDGQGNFGSVDGDPAAAMRYTEARLSDFSLYLLEDIEKNVVEFRPNYDDSEFEPIVLPAKFPNILINGVSGIAVGMATSIPPHNPTSVLNASIELLLNKDIHIEKLIEIIQAPDFPTGGVIYNPEILTQCYMTGRGVIKLRGVLQKEFINKSSYRIIISELPYGVNKSKLIEKIAELIRNGKLPQITAIRDESDRDDVIRIALDIKKDTHFDDVSAMLFKLTQLEESISYNAVALDSYGAPKVFNLKDILVEFINFRKTIIRKKSNYDLLRAKRILENNIGLLLSIEHIDSIISILKLSHDAKQAKVKLSKIDFTIFDRIRTSIKLYTNEDIFFNKIKLTDNQIDTILNMPLRSLTKLQKENIMLKIDHLVSEINECMLILNSDDHLVSILHKELLETQIKLSRRRYTNL